jgi:hypothetical protein
MAFSRYGQMVLVTHERSSRLLSIERLPDKRAAHVSERLLARFQAVPPALRRSLTFDNGTEFALHYRLTEQLGIDTFFCDPHAPWQKGGIENAIGRMRIACKRKSGPGHPRARPSSTALVEAYNNTPRKCLAFQTPNEVFSDILKPCCTSNVNPHPRMRGDDTRGYCARSSWFEARLRLAPHHEDREFRERQTLGPHGSEPSALMVRCFAKQSLEPRGQGTIS